MHEKGIARAIWVPIVLLAGVCGALIHAVVRLADTRPPTTAGRTRAK